MKNIVLIGMPSSGKSTFALELSKGLNMPFVDTDDLIVKEAGMDIPSIFELYEEAGFRKIEKDVIKKVSSLNSAIISTGGGVVLNEENIINLKKNGVIFFLDMPLEMLLKVVDTSTRPLLKEGADRLKKLYNERIDLYKKYSDFTIINNSCIDEGICKIIEIYNNF